MIKYIFGAFILISLAIISFFYKKEKLSNLKYKILRYILLILFLETTIFNINSYRMDFSKYERKELSVKDANINLKTAENVVDNWYLFKGEGSGNIVFNDIDTEIATIKFELFTKENYEINVYYTDETSKEFSNSFRKEIVNSFEKSKYIPCFFSGESEKLLIEFVTESYIDIANSKIIINETIPFEFNFIRVIVLISVYLILMACNYSKIFNSPGMNEYFTRKSIIIFVLITGFAIMTIWFSVKTDDKLTNVYTHSLVDSIINKEVSLEIEPTERLKELENPYDVTIRSNEGLRGTSEVNNELKDNEYLWDTVYYEGKYYVYFGILPAIELLVPYKLITDKYLMSADIVLAYSIILILSITFLSIEILYKWFSREPFKIWIYFITFVLLGSMILWPNSRASFYEIAVISALTHSVIGLFFIFKAFNDKKNVGFIKLFFGCLFLALSVACRPTFLLVSLIILPYLIYKFTEYIKKKEIKNIVKLIISAGIPYIGIGILLMIYNYVRFGNVFEFGANYQLTVNDIGNLKYRFLVIPLGIQTLLFKLPLIIEEFPFFFFNSRYPTFYGYYFTESLLCGYFFIAPISFIIFGIKKILKNIEEKDLKKLLYLCLVVSIFMCCISVYMAGSLQRYTMDYAWIICMIATCLMVVLYKNIKTNENKRRYDKLIQGLLIISAIVNIFICGIIGESDHLRRYSAEEYYKIRYTICFWE